MNTESPVVDDVGDISEEEEYEAIEIFFEPSIGEFLFKGDVVKLRVKDGRRLIDRAWGIHFSHSEVIDWKVLLKDFIFVEKIVDTKYIGGFSGFYFSG